VTEPGHPITEDDVHGYVDGRLDGERRSAVERYLQGRPEVAARVAAYRAQREGLRAAYAARASEPIPPSLNLARLVEERLVRRRPWRAAAAVALALGIGAAGGWFLGARSPTGLDALAQEAGANYAVFVPDRVHPVELWAAQRHDLSRWLSNRLHHPVSPPDLSAVGYRFLGGRLVATPRGAAAMFMYEDDHGARLVLFMRPMSTRRTTPIQAVDAGDLDGCAWIEQGMGYTVVAGRSYRRLLELSRHVRQQVAGLRPKALAR